MTLEEATVLTAGERALFASVADHLIPAAHGMPSAAEVLTDDRLRFVFTARPDLVEPVRAALSAGLADDPAERVAALQEQNPAALGALQLAIVAGYYTDKTVRERIGYPGQIALTIRSWEVPPYVEEGLIDRVLARGPVWRDPATGKRAVVPDAPRTYAERFAAPPEGADDGHDRA
ncbi:MAG TPA: hypothetical protein VFR93_10190 [Candidatus Limnocylindrales bacterium]|jgi:hypothetical protein|nr:hypothetical protein [Candidatus Limnocylindrales bacterium]